MKKTPKPRICRHCGKPIRMEPKPRDLGLLLHALTYRVPVKDKITKEWIEAARKHCRMNLERLIKLQGEDYKRFWGYMEDRRSRRLAWLKETGEMPPYGWTPLQDCEPDRTKAVIGMRAYRHTLAKLKARYRRNPNSQSDQLYKRYLATQKIRSPSKKLEALNDVQARLLLQSKIESGEVTMNDYLTLNSAIQPK